MSSRIESLLAPVPNGSVKSRKPARKPRKSSKPTSAQRRARRHEKRYADRMVIGAIAASSLLNGYQCYFDGGMGMNGGAGAVLGVLMPLGVWALAKQAGWGWLGGSRIRSIVTAVIAAAILACSLTHVAHAIGALMGLPDALAWSVAIGLDCGLVVSEVNAIAVDDAE